MPLTPRRVPTSHVDDSDPGTRHEGLGPPSPRALLVEARCGCRSDQPARRYRLPLSTDIAYSSPAASSPNPERPATLNGSSRMLRALPPETFRLQTFPEQ